MSSSLEQVQCPPAASPPCAASSCTCSASWPGFKYTGAQRLQPPVREASDIFWPTFVHFGRALLERALPAVLSAAPLLDFFPVHLRWRTMHADSLCQPNAHSQLIPHSILSIFQHEPTPRRAAAMRRQSQTQTNAPRGPIVCPCRPPIPLIACQSINGPPPLPLQCDFLAALPLWPPLYPLPYPSPCPPAAACQACTLSPNFLPRCPPLVFYTS